MQPPDQHNGDYGSPASPGSSAAAAQPIADLSLAGYMFYPTEEFGFDITKVYPAIGLRAERVKALPGWKHPYELMPGYPLRTK